MKTARTFAFLIVGAYGAALAGWWVWVGRR
jgi:hypothetical protein